MKHGYFFLFLLLLAANTTHAQTTTAPVRFRLSRQDTAHAVHALFVARRTGGIIWTSTGGFWTGIGIANSIQYGVKNDVLSASLVFGVGAAMPLALGITKLHRYSGSRERRVLSEYAQTGHLAHKYLRRLHGAYQPVAGSPSWPIALDDLPLASAPLPQNQPDTVQLSGPTTLPLRPSAYSREDTLDAVQGMFNAKKLAGSLPLILALPGLRLMTGSGTSSSPSPYVQAQNPGPSGGQVAAGLALMVGGVVYMYAHNAPYTKNKLQILRANYLTGAPLPYAIRAQLKDKHFAAGRAYREKLERKSAGR